LVRMSNVTCGSFGRFIATDYVSGKFVRRRSGGHQAEVRVRTLGRKQAA
jgi:hypothetical protein